MRHYARDCRQPKRRFKRRFQACIAEEEEPKKKKSAKSSKEEESRREYYISALSGSITNSANSWLVDSGASRHMTGFREALTSYRKKKFANQVELGYDTTYKIEEVGSASLQLD